MIQSLILWGFFSVVSSHWILSRSISGSDDKQMRCLEGLHSPYTKASLIYVGGLCTPMATEAWDTDRLRANQTRLEQLRQGRDEVQYVLHRDCITVFTIEQRIEVRPRIKRYLKCLEAEIQNLSGIKKETSKLHWWLKSRKLIPY